MDNIAVLGMVISSMPIGEYDRRLEILTADLGKISAFARGSRKPSSPLVSFCRPFAFGRFTLYRGKSSYSVGSAKISCYFTELSADIELAYYGFYFLELAQYFCREADPAQEELNLLYISLKALISEKFKNRLVRAVYELKLLSLRGFAPSADYITGKRNISPAALYTYNFVLKTPVQKLFTFRLADEVLEEFSDITKELIRDTADKEFNSLSLLETLL